MSVVISAGSSRGSSAGGPTSVVRIPTSANACDERARDARVEDVADDRDVQPLEPAKRLLNRVEVEQRLRRMLILSVPRVDDVRVDRRARRAAARQSADAG